MYPSPVASRDHGKVHRIATGASGTILVLASDTVDGEVRTLDAKSLAQLEHITLGALRTARACTLSPNNGQLVVATSDDVTSFDRAAKVVQWRVPLAGDEAAAAFSPDGATIVVGRADGSLVQISSSNGAELGALALESEPRSVAWDLTGLGVVSARELVLTGGNVPPRRTDVGPARGEASELCLLDSDRIAVAGTGPAGVWIELRSRRDGSCLTRLALDSDRHAEGLAFAGGVLFVATDGGVYRADAPIDQLVRWLPPLGGAHDPTRLAPVGEGLIAVSARDVRLFRTSS